VPLDADAIERLAVDHSQSIVALHRQMGERALLVPALVAGKSDDGRGLQLRVVQQLLNPRDPRISFRQETILRTTGQLAEATADNSHITPLEPTHKYMGVRVLTDPRLISGLQAGVHPTHEGWAGAAPWTGRVIESVSQAAPEQGIPGMYDDRLPNGTLRRAIAQSLTIYPDTNYRVLLHPEYATQWSAPAGLMPEEVGTALAMESARSTSGLRPLELRDRMLGALTIIGGA
jgi:hypothetical protein